MSDPEGESTWWKCHCNLQSNMRGAICHAISLHPQSMPSIPRQKICQKYQNVDRYRHVYMKIYSVIREECTCYMACNSHPIHDVEKMFLGRYRSIHTAKMIFGPYQWNTFQWGKGHHLPCHITSHTICKKHMHTKKMWRYEYQDRYSPLELQMCIKTIKKCTFHMPHNCSQMNHIEKICMGDIEHYIYYKKLFVEHFNEIPSSWGSSAMPCHCTQDLCQALQ